MQLVAKMQFCLLLKLKSTKKVTLNLDKSVRKGAFHHCVKMKELSEFSKITVRKRTSLPIYFAFCFDNLMIVFLALPLPS